MNPFNATDWLVSFNKFPRENQDRALYAVTHPTLKTSGVQNWSKTATDQGLTTTALYRPYEALQMINKYNPELFKSLVTDYQRDPDLAYLARNNPEMTSEEVFTAEEEHRLDDWTEEEWYQDTLEKAEANAKIQYEIDKLERVKRKEVLAQRREHQAALKKKEEDKVIETADEIKTRRAKEVSNNISALEVTDTDLIDDQTVSDEPETENEIQAELAAAPAKKTPAKKAAKKKSS